MAAKEIGKTIASIPVVKEGPIDEALISVGTSFGNKNRETVAKVIEKFSAFRDSKMSSFIESLSSINYIYNNENSILTDGENIYVIQST